MKTKLHFKILALFIVLFTYNSNAQFVDYEGNDTKWNIGINTGGVWQDGDIKLRSAGFGYGFMIGKGIYEAPNHFWSFDLRFRYMKGFTYGQDIELTDVNTNPIYTDYITNQTTAPYAGFSYLNNKTAIHDFSLEGVANLYWLRKHTGVLLSVFGGLGVTDYRTYTDILDKDEKIYNYLRLSNQVNPTLGEVRDLQNKSYETHAEFSENQQIKFMPSLGIGLGYQITPQLSLGFEHRVTFTLADKFDGVEKQGTQFLQWGNNDKYHYTSINLRWNIFKGKKSTNPQDNKCKPYVKIVKLKNNIVNNEFIEIKTRVTKIKSIQDVYLLNNDSNIFVTHNKSTDYVTGNVRLKKGENKLYFNAINDCGVSEDSTIIIYDPNYCPKPLIQILTPNSKEEISDVKLKVKVSHIEKATIEVKLNNKIVNYTLSSGKDSLFANLTLAKNDNYISIRATNSCGDTVVAKHVVFKEKPCFPPVAIISSPINGVTYKTASISFTAKTTNIDNVNQVSFWLNGKLLYAAYDAKTKTISTNLDLIKGSNSITLKVKNKCGEDVKSVNFLYKEGCKAPVIFSMTPNSNKTVNTNKIAFNGNLQNVKLIDQVHLKVNGIEINSGYTTQYGQAYTTITLAKGRNKIEFSAKNECGEDSKTVYIVYNCSDPFINITSPFNGANSNVRSLAVKALVNGARSTRDIKVKLNGVAQVFYYDSSTNNVTANVSLRQGQNSIEVTATNDCKSISKNVSVTYNQACPKPVVNITSPANGSNQTNNYITLSGTVTNILSKNQISIKLNGVIKSFTYNSSTKVFSGTLNLKDGNNSISVTANTNCGTDTKTYNVYYNKPCPKPVVNITSHANGSNTSIYTITLRGAVQNVTSQNQLKVLVNGVQKAVTYNTSTHQFSSNISLNSGNNTISVSGNTACGNDTKTINVVYSKDCPKPVVVITSPLNGNIVTSKVLSFGGTVTNINSQSDLKITINGKNQTFTYNPSVRSFFGNATLVSGNNTMVVTATTNCGISSKTVSVLSRCAKPTLNILSPNTGMNFPMSNISMSGITSGISNKSQITVEVNGAPFNFTFDTKTSKIGANLTLTPGQNTVIVKATNSCGFVTKTLSLSYTKACPKPVVRISTPINGSTTSSTNITLSGFVSDATKGDIQLKVNGASKTFAYNNSTRILTAPITLIQGNNTIILLANTNCGSDSKTVNITYSKPCPKPIVTIYNPTNGSNVSTAQIAINGIATNVTNTSQISIKSNGSDKVFNFNTTTGLFNGNIALVQGNNTITVTATTSCGVSTKTINVTYTPCVKPIVDITSPVFGETSRKTPYQATATITNVVSKSNVIVKLNGNIIPFNLSGNKVTASLSLKKGSNFFSVKATSTCGDDEKSIGFNYVEPCKLPVVTIASPAHGTISATQIIIVTGTALNIESKSNLTLLLNGAYTRNFSYNATTKIYSIPVTLANGKNTIKVEAGTICGNDSKIIDVNFKQITKPIVKVFLPVIDTTNTTASQLKIGGTVEKISLSSQFIIRINNVIQKGITLTKIGKDKFEFTGLLNLSSGVNIITFTGTHTSGGIHQIQKMVIVTLPIKNIKLNGGLNKNGSGTQLEEKGTTSPFKK